MLEHFLIVPGGCLTLNGEIVANYPTDEYFSNPRTNPENWCNGYNVLSSTWTGGVDTAVTPMRNSQQKVTGYKVSAAPTDGYVYYTRHTTGNCPEYSDSATFVYHATSRWPASVAGSGVSDVKVDGKAVTVTPYVAPA